MKGRSPLCSAVTPSTVPPRDTRAGHLSTLLLDPFPVCFVHVSTCRQRTQWCRVHLGRVSRVVGLLSLPKCVCETFPAESTWLCLVRDAPRISPQSEGVVQPALRGSEWDRHSPGRVSLHQRACPCPRLCSQPRCRQGPAYTDGQRPLAPPSGGLVPGGPTIRVSGTFPSLTLGDRFPGR